MSYPTAPVTDAWNVDPNVPWWLLCIVPQQLYFIIITTHAANCRQVFVALPRQSISDVLSAARQRLPHCSDAES